MSALSSKSSSKPNIAISLNNNQPKTSNRNKSKHQKTASKYSSSAINAKQDNMQLTFQKTGQKIKKNLAKQFQTFNINHQDQQHLNEKQSSKINYKKSKNQKITKSKTQGEMTTQAKSPLVKSNLSSKTKLSQYKQKYEIQQQKSRRKEQVRKQSEKQKRSKSPISQNKSRKSSPQVSPSYSKKSGQFKRVFSKQKLENKCKFSGRSEIYERRNNQKLVQEMNSGRSLFLKDKGGQEKKGRTNQFQINFPHLITESQSMYPSSSYPNTGKQSQNQQRLNHSRESNYLYIAEEDDSHFIEHEQTEEDYISQDGLEEQSKSDIHFMKEREVQSNQIDTFKIDKQPISSYQQLPLSYIKAMEILHSKIQEQQQTIKKLHKQLKLNQNKYSELQTYTKSLQTQLTQKQKNINHKQTYINFLKGYLNQEKHNNREALKQVAKNVYERTLSNRKIQKLKNQEKQIQKEKEQTPFSKLNEKRKLFANSNSKDDIQDIQIVHSQQKMKPDLIQKLIGPQIAQKRQLQESIQRQRQLKQQLQKQQAKNNQMMKEQLLKEQKLKKQLQQKRYHYLKQEHKNQLNADKLQTRTNRSSRKQQMEAHEEQKYHQLQTQSKRHRALSTAVRRPIDTQIVTTNYRPRNISFNQTSNIPSSNHSSYSFHKTPSKQEFKDPILQKYIQSKADLSSHNYPSQYSGTKYSYLTHQIQGSELKNQKKNKNSVSQMRELLRAQKQLIALNYQLQAIQKKILSTVQSNSTQNPRKEKTQQQKQHQNFILEDLQKQYSLMKKEFEKKELFIKDLKVKLQG